MSLHEFFGVLRLSGQYDRITPWARQTRLQPIANFCLQIAGHAAV
jgi:hypothetical protein